jgi:hypothetical protein
MVSCRNLRLCNTHVLFTSQRCTTLTPERRESFCETISARYVLSLTIKKTRQGYGKDFFIFGAIPHRIAAPSCISRQLRKQKLVSHNATTLIGLQAERKALGFMRSCSRSELVEATANIRPHSHSTIQFEHSMVKSGSYPSGVACPVGPVRARTSQKLEVPEY